MHWTQRRLRLAHRDLDVFGALQIFLVKAAGFAWTNIHISALVRLYEIHCTNVVLAHADEDLPRLIRELLQLILLFNKQLL